jgi:hypothetical protein
MPDVLQCDTNHIVVPIDELLMNFLLCGSAPATPRKQDGTTPPRLR